MGNHAAGRAMGQAAELLTGRRLPTETALALLDRICEPWRDCDAEFEADGPTDPTTGLHLPYDSYREPSAALGLLMVEAFAPNGLADLQRYLDIHQDEEASDRWWTEVCEPFTQRYQFW